MGGGMFNPARGRMGASLLGGAGFNPLSAGAKSYGFGATTAPNTGPVSNMGGYAERDTKLAAQKAALENISRGLR